MKVESSLLFENLEVKKIRQFSSSNEEKGVYLGIWNFAKFNKSIKFTEREPLTFKIFQEEDNLFNQKRKYPEFDHDYYQRLINDDRTKKLIKFLLSEIKNSLSDEKRYLITFPTSLILGIYLSDKYSLEDYKKSVLEFYTELNSKEAQEIIFSEKIGCYYDKNQIVIPNLNLILVVDGQHRLAALQAIYKSICIMLGEEEDYSVDEDLIRFAKRNIENENFNDLLKVKEIIEEFQFSCTILLDFDIWEQGKVFADVNFNQKPVNRSLYYDIFGSYPDPEKNDLYYAHNIVVSLNSTKGNPFYNKIKMLGVGSDKFISQAFLVEAIFPILRKNGVWLNYLDDFINNGILNDKPLKFIIAYFEVIKEIFKDYWPAENIMPSKYKDILFKTTGLGAFFMLINDIYPNFIDDMHKENIELKIAIKEELLKSRNNESLLSISNILFSKDGDFSKGAGKGFQVRLYKRISYILGYRDSID
jgi:hypothetical protein